MDVSTSNNGSIIVLISDLSRKKCLLFLDFSTSSCWEVLPKPSKELLVSFRTARLLAVSDTHIFCIVRSKIEPFNYGICFSLLNKEWEVFDKRSFTGTWFKGVVLDGSYLVLYGTPTDGPNRKEEALLRVYDLDECKWVIMGSYVGTMYPNVFPSHLCGPSLKSSILFQVAHNKVALVWKDTIDVDDGPYDRYKQDPEFHSEIYCTKFILHKTSGTDPPHTRGKKKRKITKPLSFYFEVLSHGTYRVSGPVINCGARVTVAGKGTS